MNDRVYYSIASSSPVMVVIEEAKQKQRAFLKAMVQLGKELGGEVWGDNDTRFLGVAFPGKPPAGWRPGSKYAVPDKRSKAGKDLAARFKLLPRGVDGPMFSSMLSESLGGDFVHVGEHVCSWATYEKYGETYILSMPLGCGIRILQGCKELRMSEYWKLRESATEVAA